MLDRIRDGRTDLVFDYLAEGHAATSTDRHGRSLIAWCAYHGDVSAIRYLLANGAALESLGENLDLNGAAFHGHWQVCQFLIERGADVNHSLPDTGETPLHAQASRTLVVLWVVLAGEFLISAAAVTLVVACLELALWVRIAIAAVYAVGLLVPTYIVFGLALGLGLNS